MGKDKIEIKTFFIDQLIAESANTGSRINNNDFTTFGADFHAGGIAPVLQIFLAGNRNGSSGTPNFYSHVYPLNLHGQLISRCDRCLIIN